ncbi:MAG: DegT/DnrJ/EryC1/StrS family aminotransferase [Chloroflexota bacterium]|nr:DegT/DnrJ/EryC1/StrS family aminotransferase [Chloroflexota bacterium]
MVVVPDGLPLLIRADANVHIGTGHLMRCLALAQGWQTQGGRATFITACESDGLRQRLSDEGFQVIALEHPYPDPADWEITSQVLAAHPGAWMVLDGYHFDPAYQRQVKKVGHPLLVIDDMAHLDHYYADVLLNQNIHAEQLDYSCEPYGAISDLTTFSTHPVKHVTTGEGGLGTTNDEHLAERMRWFRNHGIATDHRQRAEKGGWFYEMVALGYNYRLPGINCTLGLSQLRKLDGWLARRRAIAAHYTQAFADLPAVCTLTVHPDCEPAWHIYPILLDTTRLRVTRARVFAALRAENIGVNVHYIPVYWHPYYAQLGYQHGLCPVAEDAYERLVTLPIFPAMTDEDVGDVITAICKAISAYRGQSRLAVNYQFEEDISNEVL